jgi:hypothetical protein
MKALHSSPELYAPKPGPLVIWMERLDEAGTAGKKADLRRLSHQIFEVKVAHKSVSFLKVGT